jgi:uncharacterized membrane protein
MRFDQRNVAIALGILLSTAANGTPPRYVATKLALPVNTTTAIATGINRHNTVIGYAYFKNFVPRSIVWGKKGVSVPLPLRGEESYANAIADNGDIVGDYQTPNGLRPYVSRQGIFTALGGMTQRFSDSHARGVNRDGVICGDAVTDAARLGYSHAVYWDAKGIHDIAEKYTTKSVAEAIDSHGRIVGHLESGDHEVAFVWNKGILKFLFPRTISSSAMAINNAGIITGYYEKKSTQMDVAYWRDTKGTIWDLPSFGGNAYGSAINSSRNIVGTARTTRSDERAFLYIYLDDKTYDLNDLVDTPLQRALAGASSINDNGSIVASDLNGIYYLLTPVK